MTITFVTSNGGKVASMERSLVKQDIKVKQATLSIIEPQADTVEEIAISKAKQAFELLKSPVVVEDSAFCIDELHGFPGPYIKYALQTIGIEGIMHITTNLVSRRCHFVSALAYADASGRIQTFVDESVTGYIASEIAPMDAKEAWSDLWRIFIPDGQDKQLSAFSAEERAQIWEKWHDQSNFRWFGEWLKEISPEDRQNDETTTQERPMKTLGGNS